MTFRVGLTGGIASGKSTVSALFAKLGVPIIDADVINRQLLDKNSPIFAKIIAILGEDSLDPHGQLDRYRVRQRIFADDILKKRLEALLHPLIRQKMLTAADHCNYTYCILVIPLLVEAKMQSLVDRILVVDTSEDSQRHRLLQRDNIDIHLANAMLASQSLRQQRLQSADDIINNNQNKNLLVERVATLHQQSLLLAEQSL